jgi:hypothetical protein
MQVRYKTKDAWMRRSRSGQTLRMRLSIGRVLRGQMRLHEREPPRWALVPLQVPVPLGPALLYETRRERKSLGCRKD